MSRIGQFVLGVIGILAICTHCDRREWRGIIPLHSTKNDVVRSLGPPAETNDIRSMYHLKNEEVYKVFSDKPCDFEATKIPAGTVLLVQVTPRAKLKFTDLQIDRNRMRAFNPSSQDPDWKGYMDEENGLIVRSYKETIDRIFYIATPRERRRCPDYYAEPEEFARIYIDFTSRAFDEYSDLTFVNEKARLDNFAIYLQKDQPTWKGYIVLYPGTDTVSDAESRGERAKQYLISLGLSETRISIMIGKPRSKPTTQLYALPANSSPPTP